MTEPTTIALDHDEHGEPLTGVRTYVWRFERAALDGLGDSWTVTTDPGPATVGSSTPGLVTGADGSLMLWPWRDQPHDPAKRANWIATPDGEFSLILTVDGDGDGSVLPPVRVIEP